MSQTCECEETDQQSFQTRTILTLPDHFLIAVLKCLNLKQLLRCARVCKKWNRCVKDASIWKRIDLRPYKMSLSNLKQLTFTYFSPKSTYDLLLLGSIQHLSAKSTSLISLDSEYLNDYLSLKCFNLRLIHLENLDLINISLKTFKSLTSLEHITLKWCLLSEYWFDTAGYLLNKVKTLQLIRPGGVHMLSNEDIQNICVAMPNLKSFVINQAESSIRDDSIYTICQSLVHLEELDLINTSITDQAVIFICNCQHMSFKLKRLNLSMSSQISNSCLPLITDCLTCLESLYLTSCFGISNLEYFVNLKHLTYLNINNTSIDKQRIKDYLLPLLPNCEIEHGHEKMLNKKLMWTINGSRNSLCV